MADVMAIVKKQVFEYHNRQAGPLVPGNGPVTWNDYQSGHRLLDEYLEDGDRIFLVTVRPGGRLWLVAVYEDVERAKDGWFAREENRTKIVDITHLRFKLRFHTGNGVTKDKTKLANSLQTPRKLTSPDVLILETELRKAKQRIRPPRVILLEDEALEGQRVRYEAERYGRNPGLVRQRLQKDGYRCAYCRFGISEKYFPVALRPMSRVLHVHHLRPLMDGKRKTKLSDLITLCPTCHAVAHAIAASLRQPLVSLALLKKYYRA